jgi:mRNA interferase MazF
MPVFKIWDIIKVPFPYTDRPVRERRPALVIASGNAHTEAGLLWVLMITSSANRPWQTDVPILDLALSGLPAPSVVRTAKIATIESKESERIGVLPLSDRERVSHNLLDKLSDVLKSHS